MKFKIVFLFVVICLLSRHSAFAQMRASNDFPVQISDAASSPKNKLSKTKDTIVDQFNLKGLIFYINAGVLLANKYNANFYSGQPGNVNSMDWVMNSKVYRDDIAASLGISAYDEFYVSDYSTNMKYEPAFNVGLGIRYGINDRWGGFIQFNQSTLKTSGIFQVYIKEDEDQSLHMPVYYTGNVVGQESRSLIDLGVTYTYPVDKYMHILFEGGFNFNNVKVKDNTIYIGNSFQNSIINPYGGRTYTPGMEAIAVVESYLGYGGFLSGGLEFNFSKSAAFDLVYTCYYYKTGMEGYTKFSPQHSISLRFLINRLSF